jgi:hypothetical protein
MIDALLKDTPLEDVAYENGIKADKWQKSIPSTKQQYTLRRNGVKNPQSLTPKQASEKIDRIKNPGNFPDDEVLVGAARQNIKAANTGDELTAIAKSIRQSVGEMSAKDYAMIIEAGRKRRDELNDAF